MSRKPSTLRAFVATLLSALLPGLGPAALLRRRDWWALCGLFAGTAVTALAFYRTMTRRELLQLAFSPRALLVMAIAAVVLGTLHSWSVVASTSELSWRRQWPARLFACVLAVSLLTGYSWASSLALTQRNLVNRVFASNTPSLEGTSSQSTNTAAALATSPEARLRKGVMTFLLLGGDGGEGRWSRRTDTMIVVRADLDSGALAFVSVPRNLVGLPFPEGKLRDAYPNGFNDLANALYVRVSARPELVGTTKEPGLEALRIGISELTGWQIDHYLLVDMAGFVNMVDALGGVDLTATANILPTGKLPGSNRQVGGFKKGQQVHLDGEQALAYARSRTGSSDYARMRRQRCVVSALLHQANTLTLLSNLDDLQRIALENVTTDIPLSAVPSLIDVLSLVQSSKATSLLLAPPVIKPSQWDLSYVRQLVAAAWDEAQNGVPSSAPPTTTRPSTTSAPTANTEAPGKQAPDAAVEDLALACA
jgi:LCP family protein required for cell wall assembly